MALRTLLRDDYPNFSLAVGEGAAEVGGAAVVQAIGQVSRAASRDETRPLLSGVRVVVGDGRAELAATDSYRLAVRSFKDGVSGSFEATVPAPALNEVSRIAGQQGVERIKMAVVERRAVFAIGDVVLASRLLEGQFPDYRQLLPQDPPVTVTLERAALAAVLRRVALVTQRNVPVALTLQDGALVVSAKTPDVGEAEERLEVEYSGEQLTIGFNPTYLREGIEAVAAEQLTLSLTNSVRPGLVEAEEGDGKLLYLVMPVRMEE